MKDQFPRGMRVQLSEIRAHPIHNEYESCVLLLLFFSILCCFLLLDPAATSCELCVCHTQIPKREDLFSSMNHSSPCWVTCHTRPVDPMSVPCADPLIAVLCQCALVPQYFHFQ